jgi:TrmH family RNA methyltransferase
MEKLGRHGARLKELRRRARERPAGQVLVDGRRLALDLVRWGVPLRELYLAEGVAEDPELEPAIAVAEAAWRVDGELLTSLAPTRHPQGVLAVVDEPRRAPWDGRSGPALWLEEVQDPGNVGAIIRSAAGLGGAAVLLSPGCADAFGPAAVRGAAGTQLVLPVERDVLFADAVDRVRRGGGSVWAAAAGGRPLGGWAPRAPLLLLLGAEGRGLSPVVLGAADGVVTITLEREVESLNVAVAAGILLEAARSSSGS